MNGSGSMASGIGVNVEGLSRGWRDGGWGTVKIAGVGAGQACSPRFWDDGWCRTEVTNLNCRLGGDGKYSSNEFDSSRSDEFGVWNIIVRERSPKRQRRPLYGCMRVRGQG
jgi:hypothetical protein